MMDRRRRLAVVDHDRQAEAEKPASRSERVQARCETEQIRRQGQLDRATGQSSAACHGIISFRAGTRPAGGERSSREQRALLAS
jgi:hypothetical protein